MDGVAVTDGVRVTLALCVRLGVFVPDGVPLCVRLLVPDLEGVLLCVRLGVRVADSVRLFVSDML